MRRSILFAAALASLITLSGRPAAAQENQAAHPTAGDIYCSGMITSEKVPRTMIVITGEGSDTQLSFQENEYVYINRGAGQGVKPGDEFQVIRPLDDLNGIDWYRWQSFALHFLGTAWEDEGRLRVVKTQPKVSIAIIERACGYVQRGDVVLPFAERPSPELKPENQFDRFAAPSGRVTGTVVTAKSFGMSLGTYDIAYVNLGKKQGVHPGDYLRIFRYTGRQQEIPYQSWRFAFRIDGFGDAGLHYNWKNTPRQVLGEGVVLRTTPDSSTVLITFALRELFAGDLAELE